METPGKLICKVRTDQLGFANPQVDHVDPGETRFDDQMLIKERVGTSIGRRPFHEDRQGGALIVNPM
jgi:hypothetical protein